MLGAYYFISREAMAFRIAEVNSRRARFAVMILKECKKIQEAEATNNNETYQHYICHSLYVVIIL